MTILNCVLKVGKKYKIYSITDINGNTLCRKKVSIDDTLSACIVENRKDNRNGLFCATWFCDSRRASEFFDQHGGHNVFKGLWTE